MQYVLEKEVFPSTKAKNPGLCAYQKTKKKKSWPLLYILMCIQQWWDRNPADLKIRQKSINKKILKKIQIKGKMNREKKRGLIYQILNPKKKKKKLFTNK